MTAFRLPIFVLLSTLAYASPQCYVEAYPSLVLSANDTEIVLKSGDTFPYRTHTPKESWDEKIDNADLSTQLSQRYDAGGSETPPPYLHSPGRLRYQPFFQALYGNDQKAIEKKSRHDRVAHPQRENKTPSDQSGRRRQKTLCHRSGDCQAPQKRADLGRGGGHLLLPRHQRHRPPLDAQLRDRDRSRPRHHPVLEKRSLRLKRRASATKTRCPPPSSESSKNTVLSGGDDGTTTTRCISSTAPNSSPPPASSQGDSRCRSG
jgi:hypothetical protein